MAGACQKERRKKTSLEINIKVKDYNKFTKVSINKSTLIQKSKYTDNQIHTNN